jgi:hypothetical protein
MKAKRRRDVNEDLADDIVDELQFAIDACARAAEDELRHDHDDDKLQLLPDLVEVLKVAILMHACILCARACAGKRMHACTVGPRVNFCSVNAGCRTQRRLKILEGPRVRT